MWGDPFDSYRCTAAFERVLLLRWHCSTHTLEERSSRLWKATNCDCGSWSNCWSRDASSRKTAQRETDEELARGQLTVWIVRIQWKDWLSICDYYGTGDHHPVFDHISCVDTYDVLGLASIPGGHDLQGRWETRTETVLEEAILTNKLKFGTASPSHPGVSPHEKLIKF